MAWVDSEQMWRMEKQKRTLSAISNDSDYSFSDPEDNENGEHFLTATLKEQSHVSPVKAARLDQQQMYLPPIPPIILVLLITNSLSVFFVAG